MFLKYRKYGDYRSGTGRAGCDVALRMARMLAEVSVNNTTKLYVGTDVTGEGAILGIILQLS